MGALELAAAVWEHQVAQSPLGWELVASRRFQIERSTNPRINAVLRPNMDYQWEGVPVHINAHGLRDVDRSYAKSEDVRRILSLGDSVAFGWEVRLEETYARRLESRLHALGWSSYQVVNAGILGWDLPIELAYLEETGLKYDPDLIMVEVTIENDIYHTTYAIPRPSVVGWLRANTYSWGFLSIQSRRFTQHLQNYGPADTDEADTPPYPFPLDVRDPIWEEYIRVPIIRMAELARQNGAEFLVVIFPTEAQVRGAHLGYPTTPQQVIRELGQAYTIPVLDLLPVYQSTLTMSSQDAETDGANLLFADQSSHPNAQGHRVAAASIYEFLESEGLIHDHP